jgi:pimeloyl-ACP methyl ester carboxylesterase
MKIAIFTDTFYPDINGVARTLKRFTDYLDHQNIEFKSIRDASHFPWLEKPQCVCDILKSRCR